VAERHRVVIVGSGFGGLGAAKALKRTPVDVTVIDKRNFHLFQPLLYQVATGGLSPGDISAPIRAVLKHNKNTRVLLGEVTGINTTSRVVTLADGGHVPYDTLIVATGVSHDYFGHREWEKTAPGLKTIEDATNIRARIFIAFEAAERTTDPALRAAYLTFVVVGGGPTGVELAGALGEIAHDTLKNDFRTIQPESARIILVEGNERILMAHAPMLSAKAERSLKRLGVTVVKNQFVVGVNDHGVQVKSGNDTYGIDSKTVLWAAGVKASPLGTMVVNGETSLLDRAGRVKVLPDLSVPGNPSILVIGDLAALVDDKGEPLPGVCQVAMQQGEYAANVIAHRLEGKANKPFRYFNMGIMATIGRAAAVGNIGPFKVWGYPAWLVWLFIHLMYLVEFENRLLVFVQWAWSYMTFNRGARLITGDAKISDFEVSDVSTVSSETDLKQSM
jgi:NADH dehydrogenase